VIDALSPELARAVGSPAVDVACIGGGAAGRVDRLRLADGRTIIVKHAVGLQIEARSLSLLATQSEVPVPRVLHASDTELAMSDLGDAGRIDPSAERHAAELLSGLHTVASPDGRFGLGFDNFIGPLPQPNAWSDSWVEFFHQRRLRVMADHAARDGFLPTRARQRLSALQSRLGELIPDRPAPSLIHGDIWAGNVIARAGRIVGFIDPSPHYAHAEVELAFITMFHTFGAAFFERYHELRPIDPEFRKVRCDVYLLYPLLTHVRIYGGGGYVAQLEATLARLGF
jgi:fructosamine-3-kinase